VSDQQQLQSLLRGIFAGWLTALMVWLLPFAESGRIWVILFVTYLVGIGELSDVIAGGVEVFTLAAAGGHSWLNVVGQYVVPTLIGNILGGVTLVAILNHAQIVSGGGGSDIGK
jgi:formate/nitrite transporter FocA (FNT family)